MKFLLLPGEAGHPLKTKQRRMGRIKFCSLRKIAFLSTIGCRYGDRPLENSFSFVEMKFVAAVSGSPTIGSRFRQWRAKLSACSNRKIRLSDCDRVNKQPEKKLLHAVGWSRKSCSFYDPSKKVSRAQLSLRNVLRSENLVCKITVTTNA